MSQFLSLPRFMKLPRALKPIKGFTLIELLVVIGIAVILLGLSLFIGNDFYRVYALTSERDNLISYIRKARSRALSNYNQSAHGFAMNGSEYTIFQGSSFPARSSTWDQIFYKSPGITLNWQLQGVQNVISGSYTGNGIDNRIITGAGFTPNAVIIKASSTQNAVIRVSAMSGDSSKSLIGSNALEPNLIQSFDGDGFTIGTDARVNAGGAVYNWIAFRAVAGELAVGSYTGNGAVDHDITGIGFQPEYVIAMSSSTNEAVHRSNTMPKTYFFNAEDGDTGNRIISFDPDGFSVGNSSRVNSNGTTYFYAAWNNTAAKMQNGSYTGNGADNRFITGIGYQPEYVIIRGQGLLETVHKSYSIGPSADVTMDFRASANDVNEIQALEADGFQVGNDSQTNAAGTTYHWISFPTGFKEIIFSPLAATSSASGTIYLNDGISTSSIQINNEGRITW